MSSAQSNNPSSSHAPNELPTPTNQPQRTPQSRRNRWRTKRTLLLLLFVAIWIFVASKIFFYKKIGKPKIIHADRYSAKHKFRPAASPVITETLRDGTIRLRGAFRNPHAEHDEL